MAKRKKKKNPSGAAVAIALGVVGVGALIGWQVLSESDSQKKKSKTRGAACPARPGIPNFRLAQAPSVSCSTCSFYAVGQAGGMIGAISVKPGEGLCTKYKQSVGPLCLCDSWVKAEEYGLSFNTDCTDFVMKNAPAGADTSSERQAVAMLEVVDSAVKSGLEIDPFALTNSWFGKIAPSACKWPPTSASSARITNLYIYLTTVLSMMVIDRKGIVFGISEKSTESAAALDQKVIERAAAMGLTWNPAVIPDLLPAYGDDDDDDDDGPPNVGSTGPAKIFQAIPARFVQHDGFITTTLVGDNLHLAQFRLFDPEQELEAVLIGVSLQGGVDSPQITFRSPGAANYTVYFRHVDDPDWTPTSVVVKTEPGQAVFTPKN